MKFKITAIIILVICVFIFTTKYVTAPIAPAGFFQNISQKISEKIADVFPPPETEIKLLFVGDIMMDRSIRTRAEKMTQFATAQSGTNKLSGYDFFFECAKPIFDKYDFVIANIESPITDFASVSQYSQVGDLSNTRFTMSPETIGAIIRAGINIVGIDNNHMYDFGAEGLSQTQNKLRQAHLKYFGGKNIDEKFIEITEPNSQITFVLISFNEFFGSAKETIELIEKYNTNENRKIIIFAHWGNEYESATDRVKNLAKKFIDAGADAVVGHHPHVLQEFENLIVGQKSVPIFYSLGNFIFDQYWMESVRNGGAAEIVIKNSGEMQARLLPVYLDSERRPCISE